MDLTFIWQPRFLCWQGCCCRFLSSGPLSVCFVVFRFSSGKIYKWKLFIFFLNGSGGVFFWDRGRSSCVPVRKYIYGHYFLIHLAERFLAKFNYFGHVIFEQNREEKTERAQKEENLCIWFQLIFRVRAWLRIVLFIVGQIKCWHKLAETRVVFPSFRHVFTTAKQPWAKREDYQAIKKHSTIENSLAAVLSPSFRLDFKAFSQSANPNWTKTLADRQTSVVKRIYSL